MASEDRFRKNFINSITGFKSVALIGTKNESGTSNLAIFSQIFHVGANPPLIGIVFRPNVVARHTFSNILATKYFTINHLTEDFVNKAHHTSARWEGSEFQHCGLSEIYLEDFPAPFVGESQLQIGCSFKERLDVQSNGTHILIGAIERVNLIENAIGEDGFVDLQQLGTLTSAGLDAYYATELVDRLSYAKPGHKPTSIKKS